ARRLGGPAGLVRLGAPPVDEPVRDLGEEPGGRVVARRPPSAANGGPRQVEPLLGSGDADVGQPPLLLQLLRVEQRPLMRENAVLQPAEADSRALRDLLSKERQPR